MESIDALFEAVPDIAAASIAKIALGTVFNSIDAGSEQVLAISHFADLQSMAFHHDAVQPI